MSEVSSAPAAAPSAAPVSEAPVSNESSEVEASESVESQETPKEAAAEVKKEIAALKKKFNLKVNGKSKDVELDMSNDKEIQKYLEKAMGADEKFQEAAMTKKQMEWLVNELKTNPLSVLKHKDLGIDVKKMAEMILNEELDEMSKTPEQKELEEMKRKLKEFEEEKNKSENEKRELELQRMQEQASLDLDNQMTEALSKSSLPKSPYAIKRIADAMIEAVNLGYTNVTPEQVMPYVEQQITEEINKLFESSPDEVIEKLAGKGRLDNYRKGKVAKAKTASVSAIKDSGIQASEKKPQPVSFKKMFGNF